jgi:hypothetical protein
MNKIQYNKEYLDTVLLRDTATVIGEYEKLNREIRITFLCNCGQEGNKTFRMLGTNGAYCKSCTMEKSIERQKETFLKNYGTTSPMKSDIIKEKIKSIFLDKYLKSKEIRKKITTTNMKKYGAPTPTQNKEIIKKVKETMIKHHGVENPMYSPHIKEKFRNTSLLVYGCTHPMMNTHVNNKAKVSNISRSVEEKKATQEKRKRSCIEKYGVESTNQVESIKQKKIQTSLIRYGVEYPGQSTEFMLKCQTNAYKYKKYRMPSGIVRNVQGYEPLALDELLKVYTEDQIITDRKDIPRIKYELHDKTKYYFPDIYIPHINKIIEVKSTWTYKCMSDKIKEKADATKAAGYDYEIWVYNKKKERVYLEALC